MPGCGQTPAWEKIYHSDAWKVIVAVVTVVVIVAAIVLSGGAAWPSSRSVRYCSQTR
ncbi:MAG: hypothetical protein R2723_11410 [Microbacterium sp.]